jgi:hypothetical protein
MEQGGSKMIGSIIQVARDIIKSGGKNIENWKENADTAQDALNETEKQMQQETKEAQNASDNKVEEKVEEQTESTEQQPESPQENTDENKEQKQQGLLLSDEKSKNIKTDQEYAEDTAGKVFGIVNSVRKEIANIGKAIKGDKDTKTAGSDLSATLKPMIKQEQQYKTDVEALNDRMNGQTSGNNVPSDVCLKKFFYSDDDNTFHDSDILDAYKQLQAITFTYKPEATELDPTQDTQTVHVGLKAQDIEAQPELASAVKEDPESGYKMVDTREMTMQNAAAISEIAKKLDELTQKINSLT